MFPQEVLDKIALYTLAMCRSNPEKLALATFLALLYAWAPPVQHLTRCMHGPAREYITISKLKLSWI